MASVEFLTPPLSRRNAIGDSFHIDELMAALNEFDDSGDGQLDRAEFYKLCNQVGV